MFVAKNFKIRIPRYVIYPKKYFSLKIKIALKAT